MRRINPDANGLHMGDTRLVPMVRVRRNGRSGASQQAEAQAQAARFGSTVTATSSRAKGPLEVILGPPIVCR